jgi:hypothetical protein
LQGEFNQHSSGLVPLSFGFICQAADFDAPIGGLLLVFGDIIALLGHNIHKLYGELLTVTQSFPGKRPGGVLHRPYKMEDLK